MTATGGGRPRRPVAWAGIILGTAGLITAYSEGWRPRIPGTPTVLGLAAGAVLAWLVFVTAAAAGVELLRRHRKAITGAAGRGSKRGAVAAARAAGAGGRSVTARAGQRWQARQHQPLAFTRTDPAADPAAPPQPDAAMIVAWRPGSEGAARLQANRDAGYPIPGYDGSAPDPLTPASRRLDGKPETAADKRFLHLREPGYTGPPTRTAASPARPIPSPAAWSARSAPCTPCAPQIRIRTQEAKPWPAAGGIRIPATRKGCPTNATQPIWPWPRTRKPTRRGTAPTTNAGKPASAATATPSTKKPTG